MREEYINTDLLSAEDYSYFLAHGELEFNEPQIKEFIGILFDDK